MVVLYLVATGSKGPRLMVAVGDGFSAHATEDLRIEYNSSGKAARIITAELSEPPQVRGE